MCFSRIWIGLLATAGLWGCSPTAPSAGKLEPAITNVPPALSGGEERPPTEQDAPDFDPKLSLKWPGTPEESRRRIDRGSAGETMTYSGRVSQTGPVTIFSATVQELPASELAGIDRQEMLATHGTSDSDEELARKRIEHGPNKYPGLDVTAKSGGDSRLRRVTVLAGRRLYTIEVISLKPERLDADDVAAFFASFAIAD